MTNSKFTYILSLVLLVALMGCKKEKEEGVGRFGMMDDGTPQYTAVRFMQSIYDDQNIDRALSLSSERLARVMKRYHTNRNVQRNVIGLMYDEVVVSPEGSDSVGRAEFAQTATIHLFLSGFYGEDKIDEIRTLELIKEGGGWRVDDVLPDKFS
jgi:hypothetical protein